MKLIKKNIRDLKEAKYNPRKNLTKNSGYDYIEKKIK